MTEQKTGKRKRIRLAQDILRRMTWLSGEVYVFEGQRDRTKHRTRQRVWRDLVRAAKAAGIADNISPHSLRKLYAVTQYQKHKDLAKVQRQLNHDNIVTTLLYVMSREVTAAGAGGVGHSRREKPPEPDTGKGTGKQRQKKGRA